MITIHQFKATKEKYLIMIDVAIMENNLSCKSNLLKEGDLSLFSHSYYSWRIISLLVHNTSSLMIGYDLSIQCYQGKAPYHDRPSYHGKHPIMQVQAIQGRVMLINPSYYKVVWPHKVTLSCKHPLMLDRATLEGYNFSIQGYP
ncbi:hypothetical protein H5410_001515 [Solanum commersonii]|uniref:Uncharacterized protein n=1 Tax=Solanum commersonii TaxID=4109 RepID=A0A9J6AZ66_SOLCO|nr:hypothetical protein H5410_001515 [Solanum commersonii]